MNPNYLTQDPQTGTVFSLDDDFDKKIITYFDQSSPNSKDYALDSEIPPLFPVFSSSEKEFNTTQFNCTNSLVDKSTATNIISMTWGSKPSDLLVKNNHYDSLDRGLPIKKFLCPEEGCGQTFNFKSDLNRHVNSHHKAFNWVCQTCLKNFNRKDNFNLHLKTHNQEKETFLCCFNGCSERFTSKAGLKYHTKNRHLDQRLCCTEKDCKKSFKDQNGLEFHLKRFHLILSGKRIEDNFKKSVEIINFKSENTNLKKKVKVEQTLNEISKTEIDKNLEINLNFEDFNDEELLMSSFFNNIQNIR